jgi:hypothetical protein
VWGDPHITTFDGFQTTNFQDTGALDSYKHGDFWLVRTAGIQIQGRYWSDDGTAKTSLRALAISGSALHYQTLVIEPAGWWGMEGKMSWRGTSITSDAMLASAQREGSFVASGGHTSAAITFTFAGKGVVLQVTRATNYIDVNIEMPQQRGGQAGHCGNFNGNSDDDKAELENGQNLVPEQEVLFVVPQYAASQCSSSLRWTQLIRVTGGGADAVNACAKACHAHNRDNAWTHFGVQSGMCHCAMANINHGATSWSNTCYSYEFKDNVKSMAGCGDDRQTKARTFCTASMPQATLTEVDACVFDSCFADPSMVQGDIDFSNQMDNALAPRPTTTFTTTMEKCTGVKQNDFGVTSEHCQRCEDGYQWWPCNSPLRAKLCCA